MTVPVREWLVARASATFTMNGSSILTSCQEGELAGLGEEDAAGKELHRLRWRG
jgi:hypothetical protein